MGKLAKRQGYRPTGGRGGAGGFHRPQRLDRIGRLNELRLEDGLAPIPRNVISMPGKPRLTRDQSKPKFRRRLFKAAAFGARRKAA